VVFGSGLDTIFAITQEFVLRLPSDALENAVLLEASSCPHSLPVPASLELQTPLCF
jgi:hypothetical protein